MHRILMRLHWTIALGLLLTTAGRADDVRVLWDLQAIRNDPLDVKVLSERPGIEVTFPHRKLHLTYHSQTWRGKEVRIEAFVAMPLKVEGKLPAVLSLHGHGGKGSEGDAVAKAREFKGVGMSISGPGQGQSTGRRDCTAHWIDCADDVRDSFMYQYPYAAMRAITYLTTLDEVDPRRIGVVGGSMGAMCTNILNGLDDRIAVAVPVSGCGSYAPEMAAGKTWFSTLILEALDVTMDHPGVQAFLKHLDPIHYAPYQHAPSYLVCGAQDEPFPITSMTRTFKAMPKHCRLNLVYDLNHGGFSKPDKAFQMYDNREQYIRRCWGATNWWLHRHLDPVGKGGQRKPIPAVPTLSLEVGKENDVRFTLKADAVMPIRRVLLCWSLDGSYTFHKAGMHARGHGVYELSLVLHKAQRDALCAFAEVEYPDDFFLTCVPHFGPTFEVKVRKTKFPPEMLRRERSAEQAMEAFRKEIQSGSLSQKERWWREYGMGTFLREIGEHERALAVYDRLIPKAQGKTNDSLVPSTLYQKALVLHDLGRHKAAIGCLERAIELYPSCNDLSGDEIPRAKKLLGKVRYAARKAKGASKKNIGSHP